MTKPEITTTIKQTVSVKQRTEVGDEVFISVGQEYHNVPVSEADALKATLDQSISDWLEARVSSVAGAAFESYTDPEKGVAETDDEDETEADEEEADDEADDELTIEDVQAMKVGELRELIEAHELDVDPKLKVKELREAIIAALFEEEDEEEDEADDEEADDEADDEEAEDEEEDEEEDGDEEDEPYTEDELKALKLAELQEIAEAWELKVKHKKGADLKAKKADFVKAILEAQEG